MKRQASASFAVVGDNGDVDSDSNSDYNDDKNEEREPLSSDSEEEEEEEEEENTDDSEEESEGSSGVVVEENGDEQNVWEDADLELKPGHAQFPLYVTSKRVVYLETFSPLFREAAAFLVGIATPLSRLRCVQEYVIDSHSLFSTMSVGRTAARIIERLRYYAKTTTIPQAVESFITERSNYGTLRGSLCCQRYTIRTRGREVLSSLSEDQLILSCCVHSNTQPAQKVYKAAQNESNSWRYYDDDSSEDEDDEDWTNTFEEKEGEESKEWQEEGANDDSEEGVKPTVPDMYCMDFTAERMTAVKERLYQLKCPIIEEYFFTDEEDTSVQPLRIGLNPGVVVRPYQKDALMKMFRNGRAHSGIIVLPCGAGKTLAGIAACCTIKKSCLVLCDKKYSMLSTKAKAKTNKQIVYVCMYVCSVAVDQWKAEFKKWTDIDESQVTLFTSDEKKYVK